MMFDAISRSVARELARQIPQAHFDDLWQEGRIAVWLRRDAMARLEPDHARRSAAQTARWAMLDWARTMWPQRGKAGQIMAGCVDELDDFDRHGPDDACGRAQCSEFADRVLACIHASCRRAEGRHTRCAVLERMLDGQTGVDITEQLGIRPETVSLHRSAIAEIAAEFV